MSNIALIKGGQTASQQTAFVWHPVRAFDEIPSEQHQVISAI